MDFSRLLATLARSSAEAVSTPGQVSKEVAQLKRYLYIETDIERVFRNSLETITTSSSIIFLCGSSGDGKSEILKRYYREYDGKVHFHLDGTHSFNPEENAIEALDQVFDQHKDEGKQLVIGINFGMLLNYESSGAERHIRIRQAISSFTRNDQVDKNYQFLNFEDYPKFALVDGNFSSNFITELLERVTKPSDGNPLYVAYREACDSKETQLCSNYRILQEPAVRERVVSVLLNARLRFDQFLSARTVLDFIHHLVCGPGFLFDNLFVKGHNDLVNTLSHFDPCTLRTQKIDQFLIQQSLDIKESDFELFTADAKSLYGLENLSPGGWLRSFFLFQNVSIGNDYHRTFELDFRQTLYSRYIDTWLLHSQFHGGSEEKQKLRRVYQKHIIAALLRFGNRLCTGLTDRKQIFLAERNSVVVSVEADIKPDFSRISTFKTNSLYFFNIYLKVGDKELKPFPVNVNFLELVLKINDGYRPNKHDKNTIVILEEIIDEIVSVCKNNKTLFFTSSNISASLTHDEDDGEFVVGGAS